MDFEALRAERHALANAAFPHAASVLWFRPAGLPWFRLEADEVVKDDDPNNVHHLSTTASCFESLGDVPGFQPGADLARTARAEMAVSFGDKALSRPFATWESEGSAHVYCRARTLPAILASAPDEVIAEHRRVVHAHLEFVWDRVKVNDPLCQGVAEVPPEAGRRDATSVANALDRESAESANSASDSGNADMANGASAPTGGVDYDDAHSYPPNAFHTYWAIRLVRFYEARAGVLEEIPPDLLAKRAIAKLWAHDRLASQTTLILHKAERVDAHQLAWALLIDLEANEDQPASAVSARRELYEAALSAFFSEQRATSGAWPLYEPLFHFREAGNAYCYTFETLAELLRPALRRREGRLLRDLLRPYAENLVRAWRFAEKTAVDTGQGTVGWASGHHPHRREAEGWATAAVFSYLQNLRRLVAFWTADGAQQALRVRRPKPALPDEALHTLRNRGRTWISGPKEWSVGRELAGLFVNPVRATPDDQETIDPDQPLIPPDHARSAILFGPPGTGKTTLVEAVAAALGWDFVEVHASQFLSAGMDRVPARADEIFAQLMELDRCVIFFDEVDELIRERRNETSDPFGRFLTTSMLPKLAQLWDQRRVLFFVATNNIDKADPAIRRSQRFDASIFTAPPAFDVKIEELTRYLEHEPPRELTLEAVTKGLDDEKTLGVFALLRFDQMPELAKLMRDATDGEPSLLDLETALDSMGEALARLEYSDEEKTPIGLWKEYRENRRRDYGRPMLASVEELPDPSPDKWSTIGPPEATGTYFDIRGAVEEAITADDQGRWRIQAGPWVAVDRLLLDFVNGPAPTDPEPE